MYMHNGGGVDECWLNGKESINIPPMAGFIGWHVTSGNACFCLFIGEWKDESHSLRSYFVYPPDWSQREQIFAEHRLCSRHRVDASGNQEQSRVVHMSGVNLCERRVANGDLMVCLHLGEATDVLLGQAGRVSEPSQSLCFQLPWMEPWGGSPGLAGGSSRPRGLLAPGLFLGTFLLAPMALFDQPIGWGGLG